MTVRWTPTSLREQDALHSYISEDRASAALGMVETLLKGIAALTRNPQMGRTGRVAGSRELVIAPYVIVYRARKSIIEMLGIIHEPAVGQIRFETRPL